MLVRHTPQGIHCQTGGFHVDPSRAVDTAVTTHAHSDHARKGSRRYICARGTGRLLRARLGDGISVEEREYGDRFNLGGTTLSFHPAGHVLGSAQVRIEGPDGQVCVVSGDFKREEDPTCAPFEVLKCDLFVTESTFGNPKYRWGEVAPRVRAIFEWWEENRAKGRNSLLYGYSLGKAQRLLAALMAHTSRRALVFGEAHTLTECYRAEGVAMLPTERLEEFRGRPSGELIVAPHSIDRSPDRARLGSDCAEAFVSGWNNGREFTLSDHADWPALLATVRETGARTVLVQPHARDGGATLMRELRRAQRLDARLLVPTQRGAQGDLFEHAGLLV